MAHTRPQDVVDTCTLCAFFGSLEPGIKPGFRPVFGVRTNTSADSWTGWMYRTLSRDNREDMLGTAERCARDLSSALQNYSALGGALNYSWWPELEEAAAQAIAGFSALSQTYSSDPKITAGLAAASAEVGAALKIAAEPAACRAAPAATAPVRALTGDIAAPGPRVSWAGAALAARDTA